MSDKIYINPEVTELITVTRRDSKVIVAAPGLPGPAGPAGTTDYNDLTNKPDLSQYATQTYVSTAIGNIVDGAPGVLDTLNELAAAINDDSNYAATITASLGNKQDKVSGVSDTEIGYLDGVTSSIQTQLNSKLTSASLNGYATETYVDNAVSGFDPLPSQTGNNGKFLTTNGSTTSWGAVDLTTKQDVVSGVSSTEIGYLDGVTSNIQTQLDSKLDSADLSGYATETYANSAAASAAAAIIDSAPSTLNTLNELAAALNDDASYATTISNALGLKAPLQSPSFTGTVDFSGATVTGINIPNATGWEYIGSLSSTSGNAVSFSSLNGQYKELFLTFNEVTTSTQNSLNFFRINGDSTGSNYSCSANRDFGGNTYMGNAISAIYGCIGTMIAFGSYSSGTLTVTNGTSTGFKGLSLNFKGRYSDWITSNYIPDITESIGGAYLGTSAVNSISVTLANGTFTSGTWKLWGLK